MSSGEVKLPHAEAMVLAREVVALLEASCERIEIAGSLRRKKELVGDIEIVCIPKIEAVGATLFGESYGTANRQYERVCELLDQGVFTKRHGAGPRAQYVTYRGFPVDIFSVIPPAQFGVIFMLRTGSEEFNQRVVRQRHEGGTVLPMGMRFQDGALIDLGVVRDTPEERDVFEAIKLGWLEPEERVG